jgi:protein ImuA
MNTLSKPVAANRNAPVNDPPLAINPLHISDLKERIARLETAGDGRSGRSRWSRHKERVVTLGLAALDTHLPWNGLPRGALHEFAGTGADREQAAAAAGFAALWLAKLQAAGPVLWILRGADRSAIDLYAHGVRQQLLDPERLILLVVRRDEEVLWAMEEGLKARGLGAVLGEIGRLDLTASRRLQLAAETSGVTAFVLRRWRLMATAEREALQPIAALTRWRIASAPASGTGDRAGDRPVDRPVDRAVDRSWAGTRWRVELARCRGGKPQAWTIERGLMERADGSDDIHAAPLSGDLAEVLGNRSLAAGAAIHRRKAAG